MILLTLFYWARKDFRKSIDSEKKILDILKTSHAQNQEALTNLQQKIGEGRVNINENITLALTTLQSAIIRDEADIIMGEAWIDKVENSHFLDWATYYFKKKYFGEFFKKY